MSENPVVEALRKAEAVDENSIGTVCFAAHDALPLAEAQARVVEAASKAQPKALDMIRKNGFVFTAPLGDESTELNRWQKLAFSLYTDICELSQLADDALDQLEEK